MYPGMIFREGHRPRGLKKPMVCTQVSCVLAPYQSHAQAPAVCEASPTEGDGPDVRRERLLFNRRYSTMMQKKTVRG